MKPTILRAVLFLLLTGVTASQLLGHAVVYPASAKPGAYERYVLRVPNEREVPTTRVEIRFPSNVTVVSFGDVPGWTIEVQTDSAQRIIGAVWSGNLPAKRFVELPFIAVNPKTAAALTWPAFQTYADGERVEWTGAPGSDRPASVTEIAAAGAPASAASVVAADDDAGSARLPLFAALIALLIALVAMGLAIGTRGRTR